MAREMGGKWLAIDSQGGGWAMANWTTKTTNTVGGKAERENKNGIPRFRLDLANKHRIVKMTNTYV
jgi:hypothetical protein